MLTAPGITGVCRRKGEGEEYNGRKIIRSHSNRDIMIIDSILSFCLSGFPYLCLSFSRWNVVSIENGATSIRIQNFQNQIFKIGVGD